MMIPGAFLRKLYTHGSLKSTSSGVQFSLKNRLKDAEVVGLDGLAIDGRNVAVEGVRLHIANHPPVRVEQVNESHPLPFPLRSVVTVQTSELELAPGDHEIEIAFETRPFGKVRFTVQDAMESCSNTHLRIPRDEGDDYGEEIVRRRQAFIEQASGVNVRHLSEFSFDPHMVKGNCENFTGVAQVPLGFAGPLRVNGEHAQGIF